MQQRVTKAYIIEDNKQLLLLQENTQLVKMQLKDQIKNVS